MARPARRRQFVLEIVTGRLVRQAALALSLAWLAAAAAAQSTAATGVQQTAREWLALTDRGAGAASFAAAGQQFKRAMTAEKWTQALEGARGPLGVLERRTVLATTFQKSIPGVPDGTYAIVLFRTAFAHNADARESVTLERESDGVWRVVGYFIR
jgi:uncharacterized protein DUF4019